MSRLDHEIMRLEIYRHKEWESKSPHFCGPVVLIWVKAKNWVMIYVENFVTMCPKDARPVILVKYLEPSHKTKYMKWFT